MRHLIIGLGTGRCGTVSISNLLSEQENTKVFHEGIGKLGKDRLLPWETIDEEWWILNIKSLFSCDEDHVGDVAFYYLPYVDLLRKHFSFQLKLFALKRDREETINSYMKKTKNRNHWYNHDGIKWKKDPVWDKCYPKFDEKDKYKAIGLYWDYYYKVVEEKGIKVFEYKEVLNNEEHQYNFLKYLDVENPRTNTNIHMNKG